MNPYSDSLLTVQEILAAIRELADQGLAVVLAEQQARTVRPYVDNFLQVE
jgi:ABC-type branched-subunit amino acid transport system ATPase component